MIEPDKRKKVLDAHEWWLDLFGYLSSVGLLVFIISLKGEWSEALAAIALLIAGSWYILFFIKIKKYIIDKLSDRK